MNSMSSRYLEVYRMLKDEDAEESRIYGERVTEFRRVFQDVKARERRLLAGIRLMLEHHPAEERRRVEQVIKRAMDEMKRNEMLIRHRRKMLEKEIFNHRQKSTVAILLRDEEVAERSRLLEEHEGPELREIRRRNFIELQQEAEVRKTMIANSRSLLEDEETNLRTHAVQLVELARTLGVEEIDGILVFDGNFPFGIRGTLTYNGEVEDPRVIDASPCAICWEEFSHGNVLVELKCGHYFHSMCIVTWFDTQITCPYRCDFNELDIGEAQD